MKYDIEIVKDSAGYEFRLPKPNSCPHCATCNESMLMSKQSLYFDANRTAYMAIFKSTCCKKAFLCTYLKRNDVKQAELLSVYPHHQGMVIPQNIKDFSPRFAELHRQAAFAEQNNCFDLAGSGYRNAMEILIKDYAVNILGHDYNSVVKKSLYQSICDYLPSIDSQVAADVIRKLGNDYTHYETKYTDVDFEGLKVYFELFVINIKGLLLLKKPIIDTRFAPDDNCQK